MSFKIITIVFIILCVACVGIGIFAEKSIQSTKENIVSCQIQIEAIRMQMIQALLVQIQNNSTITPAELEPLGWQVSVLNINLLTDFIVNNPEVYQILFEDSQLPKIIYSVISANGNQIDLELQSDVHCAYELNKNTLELLKIKNPDLPR